MSAASRLVLAIAATSAAYAAALVWPALAAPLLLFAPFPALVLAASGPAAYTATWCGVTAALIAMGFGAEAMLGFALPIGIPAVTMTVAIRRSSTFDHAVLLGVGSWCIGVACLLAITYGTASALLSATYQQLAGSFDVAIATSRSMGVPEATLAAMEADKESLIRTFLEILPACTVLTGAVFVMANVLMARGWIGVYREVNLRLWRAPDALIWVLIATGFAMFVPLGLFTLVARNVFLVLLGCYFCQGLAIVSYYLARFRLPRAVRIASYALIAIHQVLTATVLALGVFDFWANFRRGPADLQFRE
jgi:uncharacterized protein YybS (DUF2232 family)